MGKALLLGRDFAGRDVVLREEWSGTLGGRLVMVFGAWFRRGGLMCEFRGERGGRGEKVKGRRRVR